MTDYRVPDNVVVEASNGLSGEHRWRYGDQPIIRNDIARAVLQAVPVGWGRNMFGRWVRYEPKPKPPVEPLTVAHAIKAFVDAGDWGALPEAEIEGVWYQVYGVFTGADGNVIIDMRPVDGQDL